MAELQIGEVSAKKAPLPGRSKALICWSAWSCENLAVKVFQCRASRASLRSNTHVIATLSVASTHSTQLPVALVERVCRHWVTSAALRKPRELKTRAGLAVIPRQQRAQGLPPARKGTRLSARWGTLRIKSTPLGFARC